MFGTDRADAASPAPAGDGTGSAEPLSRVKRVLNRDDDVDILNNLWKGVKSGPPPPLVDKSRVAFGFDTNAIFRVGLGRAGADALDYLRTQHDGPLIVPGQSLQELWNNQLSVVLPQAKVLKQKFEELEKEVEKIGERFGEAGENVREMLLNLVAEFSDVVDPSTQDALIGTLEVLRTVGTVSYVPRVDFLQLADVRHATKTPPGFKDPDHSDFFLWADFLYGAARLSDDEYDSAVLVTNDVKPDWSRNGVTHPILVAEATAICNAPFRLWTVRDFQTFAAGEVAPSEPKQH